MESVFIPISGDKIKIFKEIRSIDEAIEVYKNYEEPWDYLEPYDENVMYVDVDEIYDNPEKYQKYLKQQEFIAHCLNIKTWVENDYNTSVLHSNISFPLLQALYLQGDPKAKRVFKNEIIRRIEEGELSVILFLIKKGYIDYLTDEEFENLFLENNSTFYNNIKSQIDDDWITPDLLNVLEFFRQFGDNAAEKLLYKLSFKIFKEGDIDIIHKLLTETSITLSFKKEERNLLFLKNNPRLESLIDKIIKENDDSLRCDFLIKPFLSFKEPIDFALNILKKLSLLGDFDARNKLREIILEIWHSQKISNTSYLSIHGYLNFINNEDIPLLFLENNEILTKKLKKEIKRKYLSNDYEKILKKLSLYGDKLAEKLYNKYKKF
ncbi:MAG: hypothetical protein ACTSPW_00100 [Promethearchaeota archaeon]